jgi:hypothetical protein
VLLGEHVGVVEGPEGNDDAQEDLAGVYGSGSDERDRSDEKGQSPHGPGDREMSEALHISRRIERFMLLASDNHCRLRAGH